MCLFLIFFLPERPTHLHEREGDGKRNILLGWLNSRNENNHYILIKEESVYTFNVENVFHRCKRLRDKKLKTVNFGLSGSKSVLSVQSFNYV